MSSDLLTQMLAESTFAESGTLDIACSGGPDSSALAVLAAHTGRDVVLHHVDHGLRASSSDEADLVAVLAKMIGARFVGHVVSVGQGSNLEARARAARRAALPKYAATGHTMDDQAETVLINLLRGAGLDGLGAMTPGPEHPILGIRRTETHALCVEMNLVVAHDETNDDLRILRNRLRAELVPLLTDLSQRDPIPLLARTAELARRDSSFLEAMSTHEIPDPTKVAVLRANPEALSDRALRAWIRSARPEGEAYPPSEAELARIRSVVEGTATAAELSGGLRVARTAGILRLEGHGSGTVSS